jgi:hypothetical protein
MKKFFKERLWACLAHIPIITIIWVSYIMYRHITDASFDQALAQFKMFNTSSLPIKPIILTLFSLPISLSIMFFKKTSALIYKNAQEAYKFNLWLLKNYGISFTGAFLGIYIPFQPLTIVAGFLVLIVSIICIEQSITGIITALRGKIYRYWYITLKRKSNKKV